MYVGVPFASALANLALLVIIIGWGRTRASRSYTLFLLVGLAWSASSFLMRADLVPEHDLLLEKVHFASGFAAAPAYFGFVRAFQNRKLDRLAYSGYALTLVALVVAATGAYSVGSDWNLPIAGRGPVVIAATVVAFAFGLLSLATLAHQYRRLRDPLARTRTLYLLVGGGLFLAFAALELEDDLARLATAHVGALLNAAVAGYAVLKHRLLEIKVVVRRTLAVSVVTVLTSAGYLALLSTLDRAMAGDSTIARAFAALIVVGIGVVVLGPVTARAQAIVDRVFLGVTYTSRNAPDRVKARAGEALDITGMARSLVNLVVRAVGAADATLLLPEASGSGYMAAVPLRNGSEQSNIQIAANSPLVTYLAHEGEPLFRRDLDRVPGSKTLWKAELARLDAAGVELLCPLLARNELVGVVALGPKNGNYSYTSGDLAALTGAAAEAATLLDNARRHLDIQVQANTDELTGLLNHRLFYQTLEEQIKRASRFGSTFTLVMVDLDLFKTYNDTHGHTEGDAVLREIAQCIASSVRGLDAAFRYGGEEFAIILPDTNAEQGLKVAERVRRAVETKMDARGVWLTVSAGVAAWPTDAVIGGDLVRCADSALYEAKRRGRNCTCVYARSRPSADGQPTVAARQEDGVSMVYALAATVDAKDHFTYGHSKKVSRYAVAIGEAMGLPPAKVAVLRDAGLLHDIGKISVPDALLRKQGPLSPQEWEQMRGHPEVAVAILRHAVELAECLPAILHHHERWDGSGYPLGLVGPNIPLEARIVAVADSYDAMTSDRPYRRALLPERALEELILCAGRQFDPQIVQVFADVVESASPRLTRAYADMLRV